MGLVRLKVAGVLRVLVRANEKDATGRVCKGRDVTRQLLFAFVSRLRVELSFELHLHIEPQIHAFPSSAGCSASTAGAQWVDEPASDRLWVTARDGDVVLTTIGNGTFIRE
jgi:hypothetical protein